VFKGIHKSSGRIVAIKIIPVESELDELLKEIAILKKCDSPYIVTYYGSYFKDADLWVSDQL
jgi:serine/threonine protein kinase